MKINLEKPEDIRKLDENNCLISIKNFGLQFKSAWTETEKLSLPVSRFKRVLFCGMGGSAYAGRLIKELFLDESAVSFEVIDDYRLPKYADSETLVMAVSYSGNTEETIACLKQAFIRKIPVIGVSSGGSLAEICRESNLPFFVFKDTLNPSEQPRLGQGYLIGAQLAVLNRLGLITISQEEVSRMLAFLDLQNGLYSETSGIAQNPAKQLAAGLERHIPVIVAAEFLKGAMQAIRNPINETGKHFAVYFPLPEANHHLLEGLKFPEGLKSQLKFIFVDSSHYSDKIKLRLKLTAEVAAKNDLTSEMIELKSASRFSQTMELLQLFSFLSFYLAVVHGVNPAPVPWVDFFKQKLLTRS
ncbi:MAG: bifunctional phosphoglucose/phosphomannose isomerase, glucose/mannose-6-phosphate isomerase [Candidatus Gottesmanbacteria bacterium GW2011_GWA2_43_14]|uniref:Bifunctional phosphoglucose/phosphomannose isomerase, glucose/mannose-6-phosphate isomerase n=1 Tax=Candidatus Gottesmanbacteria bacterium GW2011_GWA2_43_14 TaxID=1618443 RepID=A0A0G1DKC9_9BACT|nr:MAG: bifunctional phosphoglucose/phosphomannose isomerase, glucose/mannose-6-phosphate isomerase [Candidatus Gottesmanbacteria bacterium GW2011_GWA2_43_14]